MFLFPQLVTSILEKAHHLATSEASNRWFGSETELWSYIQVVKLTTRIGVVHQPKVDSPLDAFCWEDEHLD